MSSCIRYNYILNRKRYFNPVVDPVYQEIPCNKCETCRKNLQDEWCVRAYFEYLEAERQGGFTMMALLTYSEPCVPVFSIISPFGSDDYCFNEHDVKRFLDSLCKYFKRHGFTIKYLICPEYGMDERFSMRPHYHCLFNVVGMSPEEFLKKIRSLWYYGMVSPFKAPQSLVIQSFKGIVYSSKYTTKDMDFYNNESVKYLLEHEELKEQCKHCLPRRFASYHYGAILEEYILNSESPFEFLADGVRFKFDSHVYPVPRYIANKLRFYQVRDGYTDNGNIRYRRMYTDFGLGYERFRCDRAEKKLKERMDKFFNGPKKIDFVNCLSSYLGYSAEYLLDIVSSPVDTLKLAKYKLYCKGRFVPAFTMELDSFSKVVYNYDIDLFKNHYFDCLCNYDNLNRLSCYEKPECDDYQVTTSLGLENRYRYYDDLPIFKDYNVLYALYLLSLRYNAVDDDIVIEHNNKLIKGLKEYLFNVSQY